MEDKRNQMLDNILGDDKKPKNNQQQYNINNKTPQNHPSGTDRFEPIDNDQEDNILQPDPQNIVKEQQYEVFGDENIRGRKSSVSKTKQFVEDEDTTQYYDDGEGDDDDDQYGTSTAAYKQQSPNSAAQRRADTYHQQQNQTPQTMTVLKSRQQQTTIPSQTSGSSSNGLSTNTTVLSSSNSSNNNNNNGSSSSSSGFFSSIMEIIFGEDPVAKPKRLSRVRNDEVLGLMYLTFSILDFKKQGCIKKDFAYKHYVALYYYTSVLYKEKGLPFDKDLWDLKKDDFMQALIDHQPDMYKDIFDTILGTSDDSIDKYIDAEAWRGMLSDYYIEDDAMLAQVLQLFIDNEGVVFDKKRSELEAQKLKK